MATYAPPQKRPHSSTPPVPTKKRQKTTAITDTTAMTALPDDFFATTTASSSAPDFEAEWAAFQADIADSPPHYIATDTAAIVNAASISAPPTTFNFGEGLSERHDEEARRGADEKEEAQLRLLDEFEEMESLEARVSRLKARREALKVQRSSTETDIGGREGAGGISLELGGREKPVSIQEDEDEDDGSDDEDEFFLRAR
jgi:zinc finger protein 830